VDWGNGPSNLGVEEFFSSAGPAGPAVHADFRSDLDGHVEATPATKRGRDFFCGLSSGRGGDGHVVAAGGRPATRRQLGGGARTAKGVGPGAVAACGE